MTNNISLLPRAVIAKGLPYDLACRVQSAATKLYGEEFLTTLVTSKENSGWDVKVVPIGLMKQHNKNPDDFYINLDE